MNAINAIKKFDELMSHLNAEDNELANEFRVELLLTVRTANEAAHALSLHGWEASARHAAATGGWQ